ncbi:MAG: TldD/PmbA family protein [Anaerolineales bacterium]|nr:TldD/PmbA family protein [Anaerolineales bacterium]
MLKETTAVNVMTEALDQGADFVELFCEDRNEVMIEEQHGDVTDVNSARMYGVGIRVLNGGKSSYTYTNDLSEEALMAAAREAALALQKKSTGVACAPLALIEYPSPRSIKVAPDKVSLKRKAKLLCSMDVYAYTVSPLLKNIKADYFETLQNVTIFNSQGVWAKEKRVYCRVRLTVTVGDDEKTKSEWHDLIRNDGFTFEDIALWQSEIEEIIGKMASMLYAGSAPSGVMDVVFEKGESSLFHEACGHPFEGWAVAEGMSVFAGKLGQQVASEKVTWVDNGAIPNTYGALAMDDTGRPARRNVLIQNGILTGYMLDRVSARKLKMEATGNGRRQNYTYASSDRMTNTYIEPGEDDDEEMITSLDHGLFVKSIGGGATNPVTGAFNLEVSEGYLIERGKITRPVAGLTISGNGADVLMNVDRVGKESLVPTQKGGFCGGGSGLVPVTSFQPRVRVRGVIVGGKGDEE